MIFRRIRTWLRRRREYDTLIAAYFIYVERLKFARDIDFITGDMWIAKMKQADSLLAAKDFDKIVRLSMNLQKTLYNHVQPVLEAD